MEKNKEIQNESSNDKILQEDFEIIASSKIPYELLNDKRVLVTGATGYVGSFIVKSLLCINRIRGINVKVLCLVRDEKKAKQIFSDVLERADLEFVVCDIKEKLSFNTNIDYIIHCACITNSRQMVEEPIETILSSVYGTNNILELANKQELKSMVYISSMEVYGTFDSDNTDVTEEQLGYIDILAVRSDYPESKRLCENMCIAYNHECKVPVKIVRLAQTFGAGVQDTDNRIYAQFAKSVINKKNIILHTDGKSEGNYCYIRDAVEGIFTVLLLGVSGEAYNVSNPDCHMTIKEMAELVCQDIAEGDINVEFDILKSNIYGYAAKTKLKLNSTKLRKLGWNPSVGLRQAYARMIESMRSRN